MSLDFSLRHEATWHNITHNLSTMAKEAGVYEALWDSGGLKASAILGTLRQGLQRLKSDPEYFMQFDAPNGWGVYQNLVNFVKNVIDSCEEYPNAEIFISR